MLLEFSIRKDQGFPFVNRAFICWDQKRAYTLKTTFGHYTFYRLMQDIISELSRPMQEINNKVSFCDPGDGKVCVSWLVDKNLSTQELTNAIGQGFNLVNIQKADYFEKKYGYSFNLVFDNTNEIALGTTATVEINVCKASSTTPEFA